MKPPYSGNAGVTLTNNLIHETAHYCQLNPNKKSQELLGKVARGVKNKPLCSTEPKDERPDALHLDINVTSFLITIACRIYIYIVLWMLLTMSTF